MSTKQAVMAIIDRLPESVTVPEIMKAIAHNPSLPDVVEQSFSLDELTDDEWAAFAVQGFRDELAGPAPELQTVSAKLA